jgi:hypothetical protein
MSNSVPKTEEEILATYGTVKKSDYYSRWYLANDYGRATSGTYYRQEASDAMLKNVEMRMWRKVQRLENRSKSYIARQA